MSDLPTSPDELTAAIRAALTAVSDPATGQSIVATGQVRDIRRTEEGVRFTVDLISPGFPARDELEAAIRGALAGHAVDIEWGLRVPHKPPRQDLDRLPTVKHVIVVAAGKGGVGKSTVSVNVARALQAMGASVGLLDADIYGPSVPKMLGQADREAGTAPGGEGIAPALYRGMPVMSVEYFVQPGSAVIWRGPMIHKLLTQFLEDVRWGDLDYLIVDLPPGTGDAQLSLCQLIPISGAIIVTTPQEIALIDVRKAVNMFNKLEVPVLGVVENMSYYRCPACGHHDEIFGAGGGARIAEEFGTELIGRVPLEPSIAFGGEAGAPIVETKPDAPHAKSFFDVAATVTLAVSKKAASGPKRSRLLRTVD
jgi:ATP-binding protein involved in chromosome partitioning